MIKKVILICIILLIIAIFVVPGMILKPAIEKTGSELLNTTVTVDSASLSLLSGTLDIKNLKLRNPEGYSAGNAANIGSFNVKLDIMSLLSPTIIVNDIQVTNSSVLLEINENGSNFSTFLKTLKANDGTDISKSGDITTDSTPATSSTKPQKKVIIDHLKISEVTVKLALSQKSTQGFEAELPLPEIEMTDIGKDRDTTLSQALVIIGQEMGQFAGTDFNSTMQRVLHNTKDQLRNLGDNLGGSVEKLKGLFGK